MKKLNLYFFTLFLIVMLVTSCSKPPVRLFAGRYTDTGDKNGLYLYDLNLQTGNFKTVSESDAGPDPSYFCISRKYGYIYAANEVMDFKGEKAGGVTALSYDEQTGAVEKLKDLVVPDGGPCYISLSPDEDFLLMANYSSSSVAVVKLDDKGLPEAVTDTILFVSDSGKVSHPHMISFDPEGKRVYLTDLGFDRVVVYDFDKVSGRLQQVKDGIVTFPEGTGPRHFVFNSTGTKLYVICELNSTISAFDVDEKGMLKLLQSQSTLTEGYQGESFCADVHIGNSGQYLYGSNRGENDIVTFKIEPDGKLTVAGRTPCGGDWPRNFVIDPSGKFLLVANQKSGNIVLFNIDKKTGLPVPTEKECKIETPSCLKFKI
jgi:6-phosphogluconolactonase